VIGFFNWPYMGRIIRGQTLSCASGSSSTRRAAWARGPYILFRELLPNLFAPMLVYATLLIPTNILSRRPWTTSASGCTCPHHLGTDALQRGDQRYYYIDPSSCSCPGSQSLSRLWHSTYSVMDCVTHWIRGAGDSQCAALTD